MSEFLTLVQAIEQAKQVVIDDESGHAIKIYGVGHVMKPNGVEHAVALFKDEHTILRSLYVEEDGKVHLDSWTVGGVIYPAETPELLDLQHHPLMGGVLFQTYIFGHANGGCTPRPAPEKRAKPKADDKKADKKDKKEPVKLVPQPTMRSRGLGKPVAPAAPATTEQVAA